jgi:hypothetical protein
MKCKKYAQHTRKPKHQKAAVRLENSNENNLNKYGVECMALPHDMGQYQSIHNI